MMKRFKLLAVAFVCVFGAFVTACAYTPKILTVTFDPNGGDGHTYPQQMVEYIVTKLMPNSFTHTEGATFMGWNTEADGSGDAYGDGAEIAISENITLYAQWSEVTVPSVTTYEVTFNAGEGMGIMSKFVLEEGVQGVLPANTFTRTGYNFNGWQDDLGTVYADASNITLTENITLTAQWEAKTFSIFYNSNDGYEVALEEEVDYDSDVALKGREAFDRSGFILVSWNTEADGTGTSYDLEHSFAHYRINGNLVLYAIWEDDIAVGVHTVTFNANGGTGSNYYQSINDTANLIQNAFTRIGYTFSGWNTSADGTGTAYAAGASITLSGNVTLYAQWTANVYKVIYHINDGTNTTTHEDNVTFDSIYTVLGDDVFTRNGYSIVYWSYQTDGNGQSRDFGEEVHYTNPANRNLYAVWHDDSQGPVEAIYKISFDPNDGDGEMGDQRIIQGEEAEILENIFARTGYTFNGWNTEADGTGTAYADRASVTLTGDITLYAQWTIKTYVITYNSNFGAGEVTTQSGNYNTTASLKGASTFEREKYTLTGWNTAANGTGTSYDLGASITFTENLTLYAVWEQTFYKITFDKNAGSATVTGSMAVQSIEEDVEATINSNNFARVGYNFAGWNTASDGSGDAYDDGDAIRLTENVTLFAQWTAKQFTITYNNNGGTGTIALQNVGYDQSITLDNGAGFTRTDYTLKNWNTKSDGSGTTYALGETITYTAVANTTLYAIWRSGSYLAPLEITRSGGHLESAYLEWKNVSGATYSVFHKLVSEPDSAYKAIDSELIRGTRADILGLKGGTSHSLMLTGSIGGEETEPVVVTVNVQARDRSGYAHFKIEEEPVVANGIGGYKNDGTLKEDAVVVYVTDATKNQTVIVNPKTGQNVYSRNPGIGWLLNNRQYIATNDSGQPTSNTYNKEGYDNSIRGLDVPLIVRFIGRVTAPEGLTIYNSTDQGGSKGDNGFLARIRDCNNITLEGVGVGAEIYGWGFHFMANTAGRGIGFEVRNLTFEAYPEDAVGMEGVQSGSTLTSPVMRCWINSVTFKAGYCANPTESDKKDGDGSCDFKRGMYYTVSYCTFENGSKTNLIGASDSNQQYHMTFHHTRWLNCRSRIPLARQANIHMYNNSFEISPTAENDRQQDVRANAYIFSEANYFANAKDPADVRSGAIKSWQEVRYGTYGKDGATFVTSRTQQVSSGNKYANFDTNSDVFYYKDGKSDVAHLTDAMTAKVENILYSGAQKDEYDMNAALAEARIWDGTPTQITETKVVSVTSEVTIKKGTYHLLFEIKTDATFTMSTSGTGVNAAVLVSIYGETMLVGSGTVNIKAGIYAIQGAVAQSFKNGKDAKIGNYSITLDSGAAKQARIDDANNAIAAIPATIVYTAQCKALIDAARNAYNDLMSDDERSQITNYSKLTAAETAYNEAGVVYITGLISAIGTVNADSFAAINAARTAYDAASSAIKSGVTNYSTLVAAESAFGNFAVDNFKNLVTALPDVTGLTSREQIQAVLTDYNDALRAYEALASNQKSQVATEYATVNSGLTALNNALKPYDVMDLIDTFPANDSITLANGSVIAQAKALFDALDGAQKAVVPQAYQDKLTEAYNIYNGLASAIVDHVIQRDGLSSEYVTISGNTSTSKGSVTYKGEKLTTCLKIETNTTISIAATPQASKITLYFSSTGASGSTMKINGTTINLTTVDADGNWVYTFTTTAGAATSIAKGSGSPNLFAIVIAPAN